MKIKWMQHGKTEVAMVGGVKFVLSKYRGRYRGKARYFHKLLATGRVKFPGGKFEGRYLHRAVAVRRVRELLKGIAKPNPAVKREKQQKVASS